MLSQTLRQWACYGGVVAAALASIATSPARWSVDDSADGSGFRLTADEPEQTFHVTVESSHPHSVSASSTIRWNPSVASPSARVKLTVVPDDGSEPSEQMASAADGETEVSAGVSATCTGSGACQGGYMVQFELVGGAPAETADIDWTATADIAGEGSNEPSNAFVTIGID